MECGDDRLHAVSACESAAAAIEAKRIHAREMRSATPPTRSSSRGGSSSASVARGRQQMAFALLSNEVPTGGRAPRGGRPLSTGEISALRESGSLPSSAEAIVDISCQPTRSQERNYLSWLDAIAEARANPYWDQRYDEDHSEGARDVARFVSTILRRPPVRHNQGLMEEAKHIMDIAKNAGMHVFEMLRSMVLREGSKEYIVSCVGRAVARACANISPSVGRRKPVQVINLEPEEDSAQRLPQGRRLAIEGPSPSRSNASDEELDEFLRVNKISNVGAFRNIFLIGICFYKFVGLRMQKAEACRTLALKLEPRGPKCITIQKWLSEVQEVQKRLDVGVPELIEKMERGNCDSLEANMQVKIDRFARMEDHGIYGSDSSVQRKLRAKKMCELIERSM